MSDHIVPFTLTDLYLGLVEQHPCFYQTTKPALFK